MTAEGKLVPQRSAQLSLPQGGVVAEVLVHEGDLVQAGQPLLRFKVEQQAADVAQAQAALERAQAQGDEQKAGPRPQEVAAAWAAVDAAQAQLDRLSQGPLPQDVAAAQAALAGAQADLQKAREGGDPQALIAAAGRHWPRRGRRPPGAERLRSHQGQPRRRVLPAGGRARAGDQQPECGPRAPGAAPKGRQRGHARQGRRGCEPGPG